MSPTPSEPGYSDAMAELERILAELEGDDLDVDVLADRVQRAAELLTLCRARIGRAQEDVDRIVTDLEAFDRADDAGPDDAEPEGDD